MDVRVEAAVLTVSAIMLESTSTVEIITSDVVIQSPVVVRFSLAPVISVAGHSISAVNPQKLLGGIKAAV